MHESIVQNLEAAIEVVDQKFGTGTSKTHPELVAAVLQAISLEQHAASFDSTLKQVADQLYAAAATFCF